MLINQRQVEAITEILENEGDDPTSFVTLTDTDTDTIMLGTNFHGDIIMLSTNATVYMIDANGEVKPTG